MYDTDRQATTSNSAARTLRCVWLALTFSQPHHRHPLLDDGVVEERGVGGDQTLADAGLHVAEAVRGLVVAHESGIARVGKEGRPRLTARRVEDLGPETDARP